MAEVRNSQILRTVTLLVAVCFVNLPAYAKYSGGTGEPNDPYQIATAEDLNEVGNHLEDWGKCFVLVNDIDMAGFSYATAVIAPDTDTSDEYYRFQGTSFTGIFDGNGHTILHLTITGGGYLGLFGQLASGAQVKDLGIVDVNITGSGKYVGGLVGYNRGAIVINCYSMGAIRGSESAGVFVGVNGGIISNCYTKGTASGNEYVGGLAGRNGYCQEGPCDCGSISNCYSVSLATGVDSVGGLVGSTDCGGIDDSFWDIEKSDQTASAGGTGKTTSQMQTSVTFLDAGWDFRGETKNGTEEIWWILEGQDYPMLKWELPEGLQLRPLPAFCPEPKNGAIEVIQSQILHWAPPIPTLKHDIYFGEDKEVVANATIENLGIYCGRQLPEMTTYEPGYLEWGKTYYWRIDEFYNDATISKGHVWSFTTANFIVVDDFESYGDLDPADPASSRIFNTWIDGYGIPTNGSLVGFCDEFCWMCRQCRPMPVHGGAQSMDLSYSNTGGALYSEATRTFSHAQDWTEHGVGVLSLWFYGDPNNAPEPMYVGIANANGPTGVVYHDNPDAVLINEWTEWRIDLQEFADQGVDLTNVDSISIGFGDKKNPQPDGSGLVFFDDIRLYRPVTELAPQL